MKELINVIGLGYIGLPTALILAANGNCVIGTDTDENKIRSLMDGELTFDEEGVEKLLCEAKTNGISYQNTPVAADVYIIAVPTPFDRRSKKIDASFLENAVIKVLEYVKRSSVIVVESTVSPGTIDKYVRPAVETKNKKEKYRISIVHAPERIIPGNMISELENNNRTIGADDLAVGKKIGRIYSSFCKGDIIYTDIKTAELSKVVENAFRDINIAYANELVKICREAGVNVYELIRIANKHPRVNILSPGPGVGGHCISVDPWFLVGDYPGLANIVLAARKINDSMPEYVLERIRDIMEHEKIASVDRVGLYGLTYKENVDDVRESPTKQLIECMKSHLASGIKVYDPYVKKDIVENQYHDFADFIKGIDLIVIMVGHDEIRDRESEILGKIVLDTRNVIRAKNVYYL